jgi:hypothetical protein
MHLYFQLKYKITNSLNKNKIQLKVGHLKKKIKKLYNRMKIYF